MWWFVVMIWKRRRYFTRILPMMKVNISYVKIIVKVLWSPSRKISKYSALLSSQVKNVIHNSFIIDYVLIQIHALQVYIKMKAYLSSWFVMELFGSWDLIKLNFWTAYRRINPHSSEFRQLSFLKPPLQNH